MLFRSKGTLTLERAQYVSATQANLVIGVSADATYAVWTLTLVNLDGGTATYSLTVMPALSISSVVNSDASEPASTGSVPWLAKPVAPATYNDITYVVVTGVGIQRGATFKFSGTGISVAAPTYTFNAVTGEGTLTAKVRVLSSAATGLRSVIVTNPDRSTSSLSNAVEVV